MTALCVACTSSATRTVSEAAKTFTAKANEINAQHSDTTGTEKYLGTFDISVGEGKRECRGSADVRKQAEDVPLPSKTMKIECLLDGDVFACGPTGSTFKLKGYIKADGEFGLWADVEGKYKDTDIERKAKVVFTARFSDVNTFAGRFLAKGLYVRSSGSALCTSDFALSGVRSAPESDKTEKEKAGVTASLAVVSDGRTQIRSFTDVRSLSSGDAIELGGKNANSERFVARLDPDGTAQVSLTGTTLEDCTYTEGDSQHFELRCAAAADSVRTSSN